MSDYPDYRAAHQDWAPGPNRCGETHQDHKCGRPKNHTTPYHVCRETENPPSYTTWWNTTEPER